MTDEPCRGWRLILAWLVVFLGGWLAMFGAAWGLVLIVGFLRGLL